MMRTEQRQAGSAEDVNGADPEGGVAADRSGRMFRGMREPSIGSSWMERYGGVVLLILMFAIFTVALPGKFLVWDNFVGVIGNQAIIGMMALAVLLPLACGVFDISVGGTLTIAVVVVTWLFETTSGSMPIPIAIIITVLFMGFAIGTINGTLILKGRIDPFIGTIASGAVFVGLSEMIANGTTISANIPDSFSNLARTQVVGIPITVFYTAAAMAVLWYILDFTPFGRRAYATGAGREAARLAGVRTNRVIFTAFVSAGILASLAGVMFASRLGAGPPNIGASYLLPAYAVAFLGSTMIRPGRFNVPGLIVALFIVAFGINGLQLAGLPFWIVNVYQGSILIIAVLLARWRSRRPA
jgi:ribose transport system permease protein